MGSKGIGIFIEVQQGNGQAELLLPLRSWDIR